MTNPLCPQGHPLGSEPGCAEPLCDMERVIRSAVYTMRRSNAEGLRRRWDAVRAAIEPLQTRVRAIEQAFVPVRDWYDGDGRYTDLAEMIAAAVSDLQEDRKALIAQDAELARVRAEKDGAYEERNRVVAALSKVFPAARTRTDIEGWDPEWHGCVYVDLPTGQASWHFHDRDAWMFAHLPERPVEWDGHTTEEKYRRLVALNPEPTDE